ncbi:MAG: hypothetical protein ACOYOL_03245, partial [Chthoniobacterales bacterium]
VRFTCDLFLNHNFRSYLVMDYIHLNPVRAGLVPAGASLTAYPWSSLPGYVGRPGRRPDFLTTSLGL